MNRDTVETDALARADVLFNSGRKPDYSEVLSTARRVAPSNALAERFAAMVVAAYNRKVWDSERPKAVLEPELRQSFIDRSGTTTRKYVLFTAETDHVRIELLEDAPDRLKPNLSFENLKIGPSRPILIFYSQDGNLPAIPMSRSDGSIIEVPSILVAVGSDVKDGISKVPLTQDQVTPYWASEVPDGFARVIVIAGDRWVMEMERLSHLGNQISYGSGLALIPRCLLNLPTAQKELEELLAGEDET